MGNIDKLAKITKLEYELRQALLQVDRWKKDALETGKQLASAQAREKVLRDALERLACLGNGDRHGNSIGNEIAIDALATPPDDTALKATLKEERERVAKHFEPRSYLGSGHQLAVEIRALEDE